MFPAISHLNHARPRRILSFLITLLSISALLNNELVHAQVTLYNNPGQSALGTDGATPTGSSPDAEYTGLGAYDPVVLVPPPPPAPPPPLDFPIVLMPEAGQQPGLSIPLQGDVLGFSIEMSVVDQVCELP
jgi:hypothetical protein